jgi:hypothetical protein
MDDAWGMQCFPEIKADDRSGSYDDRRRNQDVRRFV